MAVAAAVALVAASNPVWSDDHSSPDTQYRAGRYIVEVAGDPVSTYRGGVSGLGATAPDDGKRLSTKGNDVKRYRDYLKSKRKSVLKQVPGAKTLYQYDTVFNGFSAKLSAGEARAMSKADGVLRMWPDEALKLERNTQQFLGLTGDGGVWQRQFGGGKHSGEGVIIGDIDTGFWPESKSFAALSKHRPDADVIDAKWHGTCDAGDATDPADNVSCNNKVIGARYYHSAGPVSEEDGPASPRDWEGHGSHTASTAAGDYQVSTPDDGKISGMAPAARLAVYKVCWVVSQCGTADSVAAIEDAVNDGVDILNFSISGDSSYIVDPVHVAYFNAAAAGVFIAASAGNSGPGASTVAHNTPWMTTVAASSYDRAFKATLTLGDGSSVVGSGRGAAVGSTGIVSSTEVGADGQSAQAVKECHLGALDKSKVDGRIVACARGTNARTEKSTEVKNAGGAGMVLYNVSPDADDIAADKHAVPTIHISVADGKKLLTYLDSSKPTASLGAGEEYKAEAPEMAAFSSAGPALAGGGDLLKPDITAPGVDVVAAVAPPGNNGDDFASYQGTSMSSPHIAGLGALLKAKHPKWTPAEIRSAMMTTASQTDNKGKPIQRHGADATPLDFGAGHVTPKDMFDPGLVYDSGPSDWLEYGCAIGQFQLLGNDLCDGVKSIDPSDLNYPSIAVGELTGSQTITRSVTNVSSKTSTYFPKVKAPKGTKVTVNKRYLSVRPGQTKKFTLTITRTDAAFGKYAFGSLTWKDTDGHAVRSPIAIEPTALSADGEFTGTGTSGSRKLSGKAGYDGTLRATATGLVPSDVNKFTLSHPDGSAFDTSAPAEGDHTKAVTVKVDSSADFGKVATFNADHPSGTDADLYVYQKDGDDLTLYGGSTNGGADESVMLEPGATYVIYVDLYAGGDSTDMVFHSWSVGGESTHLSVTPTSQKVAMSKTWDVTAKWSGLDAGKRYLGAVSYSDGKKALKTTFVSVNT